MICFKCDNTENFKKELRTIHEIEIFAFICEECASIILDTEQMNELLRKGREKHGKNS